MMIKDRSNEQAICQFDILKSIRSVILPYLEENIPKEIWPYVQEYGMIGGGCLRDIAFFDIEGINDIDIFFKKDSTSFLENAFHYELDKTNDDYFNFPIDIIKTKHSINQLHGTSNIEEINFKTIQYVLNFSSKDTMSLIQKFDINICQIAYDIKSKELLITEDIQRQLISDDKIHLSCDFPSTDKSNKEKHVVACDNTIKRVIKILCKKTTRGFLTPHLNQLISQITLLEDPQAYIKAVQKKEDYIED